MKTICFTGHRPNKLYGYDLKHEGYQKMYKEMYNIIEDKITNEKYDTFISGGALGFDTLAFIVVHDLKRNKYNHINNILAIPFEKQYINWTDFDICRYNRMKKFATDIVYVDTLKEYNSSLNNVGMYSAYKMQKRNEYMVDNSDLVISAWDLSKGGTYNCIKYAKKRGKQIIFLDI